MQTNTAFHVLLAPPREWLDRYICGHPVIAGGASFPEAGFTQASLRALKTPALVIGSIDDDFLPFAAHAGRISDLLGSAETLRLAGGKVILYISIGAACRST